VADITPVLAIGIGGPVGGNNQITLTIQESEKGNEGVPAQTSEQVVGARRVSLFCSGLLLHAEMDDHEVLIDDGFDGR
jgi:hypothetical protein